MVVCLLLDLLPHCCLIHNFTKCQKSGRLEYPDFKTRVDSSIWARVGSGQATRWQSRVGFGPPCFGSGPPGL